MDKPEWAEHLEQMIAEREREAFALSKLLRIMQRQHNRIAYLENLAKDGSPFEEPVWLESEEPVK